MVPALGPCYLTLGRVTLYHKFSSGEVRAQNYVRELGNPAKEKEQDLAGCGLI